MTDLKTSYLGLELKNPLVASASPLTENFSKVKKIEDVGVAAIVMHSLFEEQITLESYDLDDALFQGTDYFAEALSYFPDMDTYNTGPDGYLEQLQKIKEIVDIPVIGSLNGISTGGWVSFAKKIEEAGADALELNIYFLPTDPEIPGADVEDMYVNLVHNIKANLEIPVAVKLNPFFSSIPNIASKLEKAGADALVLFNRFYQPDIDLDELSVASNLVLSSPEELTFKIALDRDSIRSCAS